MKLLKYLMGFFYSIILRFSNIKIHPLARITIKSKFEGLNKINRNVAFIDSYLGTGSYISNSSFFIHSKIGRFCSIGPNVRVITGFHPLNRNISTHPCFYSTKKQAGFTFAKNQLFVEEKFLDASNNFHVIIENDVWIGANVLILSGVTIKNGAVIAAGSVVTKDIEPYSIVAGVPARTIKLRFTSTEIEYLLDNKWWNNPTNWIKDNYLKFQDIDLYKKIQ